MCQDPPHSRRSGLWRRSAPPRPPAPTAPSPSSLQNDSWHSARGAAAWTPARTTARQRCTPGQVTGQTHLSDPGGADTPLTVNENRAAYQTQTGSTIS